MKYVLMTLKEDRSESFLVQRPEKFGGNKEYRTYAELEKDFVGKALHPQDLKKALSQELAALLEPVRKYFADKQSLIESAYPEN